MRQQKYLISGWRYMMLPWLLLLTLTLSAQQPDTLVLTLDESIALGLEQSPVVLGKDVALVNQMYAEREAQSALYPQLSLSGNYGYTLKKQRIYFDGMPGMGAMPGMEDGIEVGRTHNIQLGLQAGMPLVNATLWKALQINRKQVDLALQQATQSRQELVGQIKKAFYTVLLAQESCETLQQSMRNAELNLERVTQRYEAGLVAEYDKMRAEVQYANIKPSVLQAEQGVALAYMQLAVLLGLDPHTGLRLVGHLEDYQTESQQLIAQVPTTDSLWLTTNPTLRALELQQQIADESIKLSKLSWVPSISLGANYNYNFSSNDFDLSKSRLWVPFSVVSLQFQFPLFTGLKNYYTTRQAKGRALLLKLQRQDAERSLTLGMQHQRDQARKAQEQYSSATQIQATAERGYTIAQRMYDKGMGTLLEVNDAELALLQARLNQTQALYDYLIAGVEIEQLIAPETPLSSDASNDYEERLNSIKRMTRYF